MGQLLAAFGVCGVDKPDVQVVLIRACSDEELSGGEPLRPVARGSAVAADDEHAGYQDDDERKCSCGPEGAGAEPVGTKFARASVTRLAAQRGCAFGGWFCRRRARFGGR